MGFADSPREPIVLASPPPGTREAERSRRAVRPPGDPERDHRKTYDVVSKGRAGGPSRPKPAEPRPPTRCRSIRHAPRGANAAVSWEDPDLDLASSGPLWVHDLTVHLFEDTSGFGSRRMMITGNARGIKVASPVVDRVELVSLLTDDEPSVYVLDEMATPPLARQARRRPLDEFERLGLDAVRRGEELAWTREAPTRMFGAIRARAECLDCHANAKPGDLLGAFTYYLNAPVDRLKVLRE